MSQNTLQQQNPIFNPDNFTGNDNTRDTFPNITILPRNQTTRPTTEERFETVFNSIFSPNQKECNTQINPTELCYPRELPCIYEFLQGCTPRNTEDLVYGPHCTQHTHSSNRTFLPVGTQNSVNMQSIYIKPVSCEQNLFIWSFLTKLSYSEAKQIISYMNLDSIESNNLAKFLVAGSRARGTEDNSEEYQKFTTYLSSYCQSAIKCLAAIPERDKILIPTILSETFLNENMGNSIINDIVKRKKADGMSFQKISEEDTLFYIPMTMFNILDQINFLSFRIYCGFKRLTLASNVSLRNRNMIIGIGLPIRNSLSRAEIGKLKAHYSDGIYKLLINAHGNAVHFNYDFLVLLTVPNETNANISPQVFIAKRKFLDLKLDIEKLDDPYC